MKKILMFAAAVLSMVGCSDLSEKLDEIKLSSESETIVKEAGSVKVIVTSTGEWTLAASEDYNWVTPNTVKGVDGDIVEFAVIENLEEDREGLFTFTCGTATADFKVISVAGEKPALELATETDPVADYNEGELTIKVICPTGYRNVKATVPEAEAKWLHYKATMSGATENDAMIHFKYDLLKGVENRSALITLKAEGMESIEVYFTQIAKPTLYVEKDFINAELEGGQLVVPVSSNVEYDVTVNPDGKGWLTYKSHNSTSVTFDVTKLGRGKRSAIVALKQTNAPEGEEPLVDKFTVTQVNALVLWAADMNNNRLFPTWAKRIPSYSGKAELPYCTAECLFYANELTKEISSIMGVEGEFLVRLGDAGLDPNIIQVATAGGKNFACSDHPIEPKVWYHLAVVMDNSHLYVYLDGQIIGQFMARNDGMPIGKKWSIDEKINGRLSRCWWFGYSYDENRTLNGMMTEIRFWNRALTPDEINAKDHFYTVNPSSRGLISYWKFTEGEGYCVMDKSTNGVALKEALYGDMDIQKDANKVIRGTEGIEWVPVVLPEK